MGQLIPSVTATQFIRRTTSGRNGALILGCEGTDGQYCEVFTKLRGKEMTLKMQISELITPQLGADLGIAVARPVLVSIPAGFEAAIEDSAVATAVASSSGVNFGTINLGAITTWPVGKVPNGAQRDQAAAIFAFDTLVQNTDRRISNPNIWATSEHVGILDHDQAFMFLTVLMIGGVQKPWVMADQAQGFTFLREHVFYPGLKGKAFDLGAFEHSLKELKDVQLEAYSNSIPAEWSSEAEFPEAILNYVSEARSEATKLIDFVKHTLR
jgi:hypothetical protein